MHLEAFSIQLVILAIWKQALHICHAQAVSDMEGSPSHGTSRLKSSSNKNNRGPDSGECSDVIGNMRPEDVSHQIEGEFLQEVENAEQLAKLIEHGTSRNLCITGLFIAPYSVCEDDQFPFVHL